MTDLAALDALIDAVTAGGEPTANEWRVVFPNRPEDDDYHRTDMALSANVGWFDPARNLFEELLPGWIWGRQVNGAMWVAKRPHTFRAPVAMDPARGLSLATLKAYRAGL